MLKFQNIKILAAPTRRELSTAADGAFEESSDAGVADFVVVDSSGGSRFNIVSAEVTRPLSSFCQLANVHVVVTGRDCDAQVNFDDQRSKVRVFGT